MTTDVTNETPFKAADLIGSAGVGENGEKLVATLDTHYPPDLSAALLKTENRALADDLDLEQVARIAGVKEIEAATVRGGERHTEDAWVTYVFLDDRDTASKGAFPYSDLGKKSSDRHASQRDSLANSPAARDHLAAKEKAQATSDDVDALRQQVEALTARLDEKPPAEPEPVDGYDRANAAQIAKGLQDADRAVAERVLAYEGSHENRSTVKDAAEKRIAAIDAEAQQQAEQEAEAKRQLEADNEALRKQVEELQAAAAAAKTGGGKEAPPKP